MSYQWANRSCVRCGKADLAPLQQYTSARGVVCWDCFLPDLEIQAKWHSVQIEISLLENDLESAPSKSDAWHDIQEQIKKLETERRSLESQLRATP